VEIPLRDVERAAEVLEILDEVARAVSGEIDARAEGAQARGDTFRGQELRQVRLEVVIAADLALQRRGGASAALIDEHEGTSLVERLVRAGQCGEPCAR
jgi:hypothetical protein